MVKRGIKRAACDRQQAVAAQWMPVRQVADARLRQPVALDLQSVPEQAQELQAGLALV